jgi:hypothetical protein
MQRGASLTLVIEAIPQVSLQVRVLFTSLNLFQLWNVTRCCFFMANIIGMQGVHVLPDFARKLSDAVASLLDNTTSASSSDAAAAAAAADGDNDAEFRGDADLEDVVSICCDCLSEIAKACKLASLNRDCPLHEVCTRHLSRSQMISTRATLQAASTLMIDVAIIHRSNIIINLNNHNFENLCLQSTG